MLEKFQRFMLIKNYVADKNQEISEFNQKLGMNDERIPNGRRMTNLGIFRKYLEAYLKNNPNINQDMTFLVRQLQPSETGIPLEIYVFSKNKNWNEYENIQADIFDHILAIIPEFGLHVFQSPSGNDFRDLTDKLAEAFSKEQPNSKS
jgi:miniconductance mechanosensitive channel